VKAVKKLFQELNDLGYLWQALAVREQGCQMVCFQSKNPNLGRFWSALGWKMLVYFMVI
jgi:hypothetical protein